MGKDRLTCYCKVMGPNFESLTVRALGLATLQKPPDAGQLTLGSYFSDLDLRYKISSQGQLPGPSFFSMGRAWSDPIGHKTASHLSSTGIPGEPRRGSMRVLSPRTWEGIDGPTEGGERTLITSRLGSPGFPVHLKYDAVLWPIGSLRARRFKTDSRRGRRTWEDIMVEQAEI